MLRKAAGVHLYQTLRVAGILNQLLTFP